MRWLTSPRAPCRVIAARATRPPMVWAIRMTSALPGNACWSLQATDLRITDRAERSLDLRISSNDRLFCRVRDVLHSGYCLLDSYLRDTLHRMAQGKVQVVHLAERHRFNGD